MKNLWWRRLFFVDEWKAIHKGLRSTFLSEDSKPLDNSVRSEVLSLRAEKEFTKLIEEKAHQNKNPTYLVLTLMYRLHKTSFWLWVLTSIIQALLVTVARPLLLRNIIVSVEENDQTQALIFAVVISIVLLLEGIVFAYAKELFQTNIITPFMCWSSSLLHKKSLTVSTIEANKSQLTLESIIGNDLVRAFEEAKFTGLVINIIISLFGGFFVLVLTLKLSSVVGISICLFIIVLNTMLAQSAKKIEEKDFKKSDERISLMSELLEGIKAIKLTAWEYPFRDLLMRIRNEEVKYIKLYRLFSVTNVNLGRASPPLAACFSVLTLVAINESDAQAANLFVAMASFLNLRFPCIGIPVQSILLNNFFVILDRIGKYLLLPDSEDIEKPTKEDNLVELDDCTFSYSSEERIVKDDNEFILNIRKLRVKKNHMTAVIGRVGNGKTSLIKAILGNLQRHRGSLRVSDSIGFVPQQPFVLSGTVRDNILVGKKYDQAWFNKCLEMSDFAQDLNSFKQREFLEIGERGQTLSGGQKQRLAICRALYAKPKLLILDDPLSAVDPLVGNRIFQNLKDLVATTDTTLLMTLNQFYLLEDFDNIYVLNHGSIVESGSYSALSAIEGSQFQKMLKAIKGLTPSNSSSDLTKLENKKKNEENSKIQVFSEAEKGVTLVQEDFAQTGSISSKVLRFYFKGMGYFSFFLSLVFAIICYSLLAFNDSKVYAKIPVEEDIEEVERLTYVYVILSFCHIFFIQALSMNNGYAAVRASKYLHDECIDKLLHTPINWFESNPSGRILSRFSGDLSQVDRILNFIYDELFQFVFILLALCIVVSILIPYLILILLFGTLLFGFQVYLFDRTNREVKRHCNQSLSPVLTNLSETVSGKLLASSMKLNDYFIKKQELYLNTYIKHQVQSSALISWSQFFIGIITFILCFVSAVVIVLLRERSTSAQVGLALTYCFLIPYFLQMLAALIPMGVAAFTSFERILEYLELPQEPDWHNPLDDKLQSWPTEGRIQLNNVFLVYREGLDPALKGVNLDIPGRAKVGIVGRTGAGKSSLTLLLFRVYDCTKGSVVIDGINIKTIGLQKLRQSIASIPQHPLLLRGSVRKNLDPFDKFTDEQVASVLDKVGLARAFKEDKVGNKIEAMSLSIGQRQLISLGRVLLKKTPKIVVLDEPTASIDQETDEQIQNLVRRELRNSTVLTIAHRLDTIIDSDFIAVMDKGKVMEFAPAKELLKKTDSLLYGMVSALGPIAFDCLLEKANNTTLTQF